MEPRRRRVPFFAAASLVLLADIAAVLAVDALPVDAGSFKDGFCHLAPLAVPPAALVLLIVGVARIRACGLWVLAPLAAFLASFLLPTNIIFLVLGGYVLGQ